MKRPIGDLSVHPDNLRIYGEPDDGLKDNLAQFGLQHAIVINPDGQILSGARRWCAAKALGWEEIDAETADPGDGDATALYILNANAYRKAKTSHQLKMEADEFLRLLKAGGVTKDGLKSRAKERGITTGDPSWSEATAKAKNKPWMLAAAAAGMSHMTYSRYRYLLDGTAATEIEEAYEAEEIGHDDAVGLKKDLRVTIKKVERDEVGLHTADKATRKRLRKAKIDHQYTAEQKRLKEATDAAIEANKKGKAFLNALAHLKHSGHTERLDERHALILAGTISEIVERARELADTKREKLHVVA